MCVYMCVCVYIYIYMVLGQFSVLWHGQMILIQQRRKRMLHKCPKDANDIKVRLLISLGRILFIIDCSNHDKKCPVRCFFCFFFIYIFRFPLTEDHFIFSLILCKNQLLVKLLLSVKYYFSSL